MDITFIGPVFDCTGYGVASRGYALAMHNLGYKVKVVPLDIIKGHRHDFPGHETLVQKQNTRVKREILFICSHPRQIKGYKKKIISLTFERTEIPKPKWISVLSQYDLIIVPCHRNAEVLAEAGIETKIQVLGYGINPAPVLPKPDLHKFPFTFVSVFTWGPRKNIEALVRTYAEEFSNDGKTRLFLKTFIKNGTSDEYQYIREQINNWVGLRTDIVILDQPFTEIHFLLNMCHAYVCTSLDEGFCLPAAESLMCGLPVITVRYGGQLEYCNSKNCYLVDYDFRDGYAWIKHAELRYTMRYVYEHFDEAQEKSLAGRREILENYNWEKNTKKILNMI